MQALKKKQKKRQIPQRGCMRLAVIGWRMCSDVKELNPAPREARYTSSGTKALTEIMVLQYKTSSDLKFIVKSTTVLLQ